MDDKKPVTVKFVRNCVAAGSVWGKGDSAPLDPEEAARIVRAGDAVLVVTETETATMPAVETTGQ